eukprot:161680_1
MIYNNNDTKRRKISNNSMEVDNDSDIKIDDNVNDKMDDNWIDNDYICTRNYDITTRGVIECDPKDIELHGNEKYNPDWIIYELETLTQSIFRCIRYCRGFEIELHYRYRASNNQTDNDNSFNIYNDIDIHRTLMHLVYISNYMAYH